MTQTASVIEYPRINFGEGVSAVRDVKKLRAYLHSVNLNEEVKEVHLLKDSDDKWKFYYSNQTDTVMYIDAFGKSQQCTYDAAMAWYRSTRIEQPLGNSGELTMSDLVRNNTELNQLLKQKNVEKMLLEEEVESRDMRLAELEKKIITLSTLTYIPIVFLVLIVGVFGFLIYHLDSKISAIATATHVAPTTAKPELGQTEWQNLLVNADYNTQNHELVGKTTTAPLLVSGHDLELTWIYKDKTYMVKNRFSEYGVVIIPQGATIHLLNSRGWGMKVYVTPKLVAGVPYLLQHYPPDYTENYSNLVGRLT